MNEEEKALIKELTDVVKQLHYDLADIKSSCQTIKSLMGQWMMEWRNKK
jgi:hypothetical protein